MSARAPYMQSTSGPGAQQGLPRVNYYLPMVVTLAATLLILVVVAALTLVAVGNTFSQLNRVVAFQQETSVLGATLCGLLSMFGVGASIYFLVAAIKGIRDLMTPMYYTRGVVASKRTSGGRRTGSWLSVAPSYAGPDLATASTTTEEERAAAPDRSQVFQSRFGPPATQPSSYLPAGRISNSGSDPLVGPVPLRSSHADGENGDEDEEKEPHLVFRVDAGPFQVLDIGDEVLVAHSRYLQHIFYVAHLRGGEWEAFRNKELI